MRNTHTFLGALAIGVVVISFSLGSDPAKTTAGNLSQPSTSRPSAPPLQAGHLILHVEGDIRRLQVTWITPKKSEYNKVSGTSPFSVVLLDAAGQELGSYPVDLSRFDLDARNIGKPLRVEGCEVWDTKISTIVNVPYLPAASAVEFRRGAQVLGMLAEVDYRKMIAAGGEPR